MVADIRITGAEGFGRLAKALKQAGEKDLQRELFSGINRATKPLRADVKKNAPSVLPSRGGLGRRVARTGLSTRRRTGRDPGVRIVARPNAVRDPLRLDRGRARHPTFGRRPWVLQNVTPGWFTKPMEEGGPAVRAELLQVIQKVADKVMRSV